MPGGISRITSDYSPFDLTSWVPPWFRRSLGSFARLSKFHSTTTSLRLIASPSASQSTNCHSPRGRMTTFVQGPQELGTLHPTLAWPFTFQPCPPTSCLIRHEPIPTFQSSNGRYALRRTKSTRRFAPLAGRCLSGLRYLPYPHIQLFAERLLSDKHRYPQTGSSHLAANLVLPPHHYPDSISGVYTAKCRYCILPTSLDQP